MTDDAQPGCASGTWLARRERRGEGTAMPAPGPVTVYVQDRSQAPAITSWHVQEAFEEGLRRGRTGG